MRSNDPKSPSSGYAGSPNLACSLVLLPSRICLYQTMSRQRVTENNLLFNETAVARVTHVVGILAGMRLAAVGTPLREICING
jgi:hypothetical protein